MRIPHDAVGALMDEVAARIVMPRFGALQRGDIEEKRADDFVTIADRESELFLAPRLADLIPGSRVLGEEAVHDSPGSMALLESDEPIWIVDPVDGTRNFINRNPHFAVIVALARAGELLGGWILAPALRRRLATELGAGVRSEGGSAPRARLPGVLGPPGEFVGRLPDGRRARDLAAQAGFDIRPFRGSGAITFLEFADGAIDVGYLGRGWPWDHAAGFLAIAELGGLGRFLLDDAAYTPRRWNTPLMFARDEALWRRARAALIDDARA